MPHAYSHRHHGNCAKSATTSSKAGNCIARQSDSNRGQANFYSNNCGELRSHWMTKVPRSKVHDAHVGCGSAANDLRWTRHFRFSPRKRPFRCIALVDRLHRRPYQWRPVSRPRPGPPSPKSPRPRWRLAALRVRTLGRAVGLNKAHTVGLEAVGGAAVTPELGVAPTKSKQQTMGRSDGR